MTRNANRAVFGACLLLFAFAGLDAARLFAQAAPTADSTSGTITSTQCGSGTRESCGTIDIMKCSWKFEFNIQLIGKGGGLSMGEYDCQKIGTKTLYKDAQTGTGGSCRITSGVGSTGATGIRGSGDEMSDDFCL